MSELSGPSQPPQMDCTHALVEIYTYLDGELTEERRTIIATHLDMCGPCLEIYHFEAELRTVVQQRCRDQAPEHLRVKILEAIQGMEPFAEEPPSPL